MPLKLDIKKKLVARSERVKCVEFHPTENWILVSLYDGKVHIWHYETQQLLKTFDINDGPVRSAKFVARKNWIICGSDGFKVTIFNYNTSERVRQFDAHSDYLRSIVIHPTHPYFLTASDDCTIKLWDWDKDFANVRTYEGHEHYVMQLAINPKDSNIFASACLDKTIKVWQLGSSEANFTLRGHERGVNCLDYYPGGEKPYLISGADDKTIKIWDYQTKTCIQTLDLHTDNLTSVIYYPDIPIFLSAAEDSVVRVWNVNTYRLEQTFNYGMGRIWSMAALKNNNTVVIGYDNGTIVLKLGREEPIMSMDNNGKIVWAKKSEVHGANASKPLIDKENIKDGAVLPLQSREIGICEIMPQSIQHNSNGTFITVCGDGQYIIHTALAFRNNAFGNAIEFVWAAKPNVYATREGQGIKVYKDFKLYKQFKPDFGCEGIFGGHMLGVKTLAGLALYDWDTLELIRRIEVEAKGVYWSKDGELLCISSEESYFILKYFPEIVAKGREVGTEEYVSEDGHEHAFDVITEIDESVKSGLWVCDCFVYSSSDDKLNYYVDGEIVTISHLDKCSHILGYQSKENRIYLAGKDLNVVSYSLPLSVLNYQTAVMRDDLEEADKILPHIPENQKTKLAYFLEKQNQKERAFQITNDLGHKFDLAICLKNLEVAYQLAEEEQSNDKRRQVSNLAVSLGNLKLAAECMSKNKDYGNLINIGFATGSRAILEEVARLAEEDGIHNIAFLANEALGNKVKALEILTKTKTALRFAALKSKRMKDTIDD